MRRGETDSVERQGMTMDEDHTNNSERSLYTKGLSEARGRIKEKLREAEGSVRLWPSKDNEKAKSMEVESTMSRRSRIRRNIRKILEGWHKGQDEKGQALETESNIAFRNSINWNEAIASWEVGNKVGLEFLTDRDAVVRALWNQGKENRGT
ncbi:Uncharacterized protein TCM_040862 [Theobroma cacao]|uniref:Uncharacterized protein n=1 Tax=Theobroma cacao TaxID=3641 RepID=A0A061GZD4_THECC|nr:Uncharacterized protein TCM_040862 [Theobroma cacao]